MVFNTPTTQAKALVLYPANRGFYFTPFAQAKAFAPYRHTVAILGAPAQSHILLNTA
jgi:hypothetical protein